jgi:hypothetical protein
MTEPVYSDYQQYVKQWVLRYISIDETLSFATPMRESIFFNQSSVSRRIFENADLSVPVLLEGIGYSSLAYNWATLREDSGHPLICTPEAWDSIYRKYREDTRAHSLGVLPMTLNSMQERGVQSVFDNYEKQLASIASPSGVMLIGTALPPRSTPERARIGMGGGIDRHRPSPLHELLYDSRDPHPVWRADGTHFTLIVAAIPNTFLQPYINWSHARGGRILIHRAMSSDKSPLANLGRVQRQPVSEYLALNAGTNSYNTVEVLLKDILESLINS